MAHVVGANACSLALDRQRPSGDGGDASRDGDIVDAPCGDTAAAEHDPAGDCLLLDLLERYHPEHPDWPRLAPRFDTLIEATAAAGRLPLPPPEATP